MRLYSCLLLILVYATCLSQEKNDLKQSLLDVKDASFFDSTLMFTKGKMVIKNFPASETKAEVYLYYGNYFYYTHQLGKAIEYFKLSLKEATIASSNHFIVLAKIRLAFLDFEEGNHIQAEKTLNELLELSIAQKDYTNILELYNLIGINYETKNDSKAAVELYYKGLTLAEEKNMEYYPGVFRNNLGLIKLYSGQVKEALTDFTEGLKMAEKEKNLRLANHLKINMCLANITGNNYKNAEQLLKEAIPYAKSNNLPKELSNIYANIGSTLTYKKEYEAASGYFDSAIVILKDNQLYNDLAHAYMGKAAMLVEINNIAQAEKYMDLTSELNRSTKNLDAISNYHLLMYRIFSINKNFEKALDSYIQYVDVRDSINNNINNKILEDFQYNYKVQLKEAELEKEKSKSVLLEVSNQKEKNNKWLAIGIAVILLITILIYFYNRYLRQLKAKQEQFSRLLIKNIEEERKRIAMDLHDDIGQSLSIIKSKIINTSASGEIEEDLSRVINQTREISRNLYPSSLEKIGLVRAVASLMQNLQAIEKLECSFDIDEKIHNVCIEIQTNIYRIIQECVNNTILHSGATGLKVSIVSAGDDFILTYMNNGSGFKAKKANKGIGLLSIQERAKIIGGNIEIDEKSEKGFKLILKFKAKIY